MAVRLMGTVFCTAFATVTGTARFGAVSADLVAQAESQSSTMGRTIVRTAVRDLFCRRIISYFERCEELQVFAHASGMADLVRGQFPDLNSIYFTACDHVRPNFCARGGRKFRGGSTRTFFYTPLQGFRRSARRKASRKFSRVVTRRRLGRETRGRDHRRDGCGQRGMRWGANPVRRGEQRGSHAYF